MAARQTWFLRASDRSQVALDHVHATAVTDRINRKRHAGAGSAPAQRGNEPKIILLVRLLSAIDEGRYSFEQLRAKISDERPPSTRSLRRYLAILSEAGFPLYFDRTSNTYRFAGGYSLKRLQLSQGELFGLVSLRALGASLGGTISSYIDEVTGKLLGSSGPAAQHRAAEHAAVMFRVGEVRLSPDAEKAFGTLTTAEQANRTVTFRYEDKLGARSTREVDPYGFIVSGGRVYLVGHDHRRHDMRTFAIDSVAECRTLPRTFRKPPDFDLQRFGGHSVSGVLHGSARTAVTARFARNVAKAAAAARIVAEQHSKLEPDGSIAITYEVSNVDELIRWILSWGPDAEIIAPAAARERCADFLQQMRERYAAPAGRRARVPRRKGA